MRALKIVNTITSRDERSLTRYLNDISKYNVLSPDEEVELFRQISAGNDSALTKIVRHNLRFVVSVAKQYHFKGMWLGDLINEGNIGLIKAAKRFDYTKGFKFISYAVWWIRQSIISAINDKSRKIRIPTNVKALTAKILQKQGEILQLEEREATLDELSEATNLTTDKITTCLRYNGKISSLDAPVGAEAEASLVQLLPDSSIPEPDHMLVHDESVKKDVAQLLNSLESRQATVLSMYYGIGTDGGRTLEEIADFMGLTRERVRQIKSRALRRLRSRAEVMVG